MRDPFGPKSVEEFGNSALGEEKRKVGNPRTKKKFSRSFSVPKNIDEMIESIIEECNKSGVFGVTRSDVLVIAFNKIKFESVEEKKSIVKDIKLIK